MSDTERLRALLAASTPGPWVVQEPGPNDPGAGTHWIDTHAFEDGPEPVMGPDYAPSIADSVLAASAVNALPALLDENAALRERLAALEGVVRAIASPDALLDANEAAFGAHAARRMQEQASAALEKVGHGPRSDIVTDHEHAWLDRQQGAGRYCPGCDTMEWAAGVTVGDAEPCRATPEGCSCGWRRGSGTDSWAIHRQALANARGVTDTPKCADCGGGHPSGHPWYAPPPERGVTVGDGLREAAAKVLSEFDHWTSEPRPAAGGGTVRLHNFAEVQPEMERALAALRAALATQEAHDGD